MVKYNLYMLVEAGDDGINEEENNINHDAGNAVIAHALWLRAGGGR